MKRKVTSKQIWDNIVKMGAESYFDVGSPDYREAVRCRISGYLNALSDFNIIPEEDREKLYGDVWLWYRWNKTILEKRDGK